jgi:hypothetical protein
MMLILRKKFGTIKTKQHPESFTSIEADQFNFPEAVASCEIRGLVDAKLEGTRRPSDNVFSLSKYTG